MDKTKYGKVCKWLNNKKIVKLSIWTFNLSHYDDWLAMKNSWAFKFPVVMVRTTLVKRPHTRSFKKLPSLCHHRHTR